MRHGRGFTLIEMLISVSIVSIMMLGIGLVMLIAVRALPDVSSPTDAIITAGDAAEQLANELKFAVTFTVRDVNTVEFTVADRNGDEFPETIRYAWSGIAGDPLTRQYNGGNVVTIAEDVNDFVLDYHTKTASSPPNEGGSTSAPVFEEFIEAKLTSKSTAITVLRPGGTSSGDLLIAAIATDGDTQSSLSAPVGWSLVAKNNWSNNVTIGVWWKLAGDSESSSYQFTWSNSEEAYGWIMRLTGHDATYPIDAAASANQDNNTSPTSPAVTSTIDNALILRLGAFDHIDITIDSPGLSGHTAITMDRTGTGSGSVSGGAGYIEQPIAGDSGISSFSLTNGEESAMVTTAIAPDPGGGGGGGSDKYENVYVNVRLQVGDDPVSRIDTAVQVLNAPEVPAP